MKSINSRGFTLLEVLIASTILIAVIAVSTMAYNTAVRSKLLARKHLEISQSMPFILSDVRRTIRINSNDSAVGAGRQGYIAYDWQATVSQFKPPFSVVDAESGTLAQFEPRFRLWNVSVVVRYKDYQRTFTLNEVSWLNEG